MASVVLEEEYDEEYEPTEDEIIEYAKFLGMDPDKEKHLLWIARDSLKAPLPSDWKPCQTDDGNIYYFNFKSGESIWDHPCDEHYRNLYQKEKEKAQAQAAGSLGSGGAKAAASANSVPAGASAGKKPSASDPKNSPLGDKILEDDDGDFDSDDSMPSGALVRKSTFNNMESLTPALGGGGLADLKRAPAALAPLGGKPSALYLDTSEEDESASAGD
ncbi:hypothetical protein BC831DRAFT_508600 [Entophlyctis helioformis]|nr:hypothetical protein BC831DRAFT_508600 [Entophlyctis helioformis]